MRQDNVKGSGHAGMWRTGEWVWGGVGLGAAGLSACFAAYMLAYGPAEGSIRSLGDFGIFARMRPSSRVADTRVDPVLRAASRRSTTDGADLPPALTASAPVDFSPTGSVIGKADGVDAKATMAAGMSLQNSDRPLPAFILRDVFDGRALVETPRTITLVSKGSMLDGAGEVLSIERRGNQWTVITSAGVIGAAR